MRLIHISAWNDSGGGFTHRLFDGHPGLRCWPFELLLGRDATNVDRFGEDWFRGRFRWPRFDVEALKAQDGAALFASISDTELKSVLQNASDAKHRDFPISLNLSAWQRETALRWEKSGRFSQSSFIESYISAFFYLLGCPSDNCSPVLAHCPCIILDASEVWADLPDTRFICVVRSPLSGFADMRFRHPGLDPVRYAAKWSLINGASALWAGKASDRVRILHLSDLMHARQSVMRDLCAWLDIEFNDKVLTPSWCGRPLSEDSLGPFGGVPTLSSEREIGLIKSIDTQTTNAIRYGTEAISIIIDSLGYGPMRT